MGSYAETTQQDWRTVAEGQVVAGPGVQMPMPGAIAIGEKARYSYKGEFTPEVAAAIGAILQSSDRRINELLGLTEQAVSGVFGLSESMAGQIASMQEASAQQIGKTQEKTLQQVSETALGEPSVFTKWLPYIIIGLFAIAVVTR